MRGPHRLCAERMRRAARRLSLRNRRSAERIGPPKVYRAFDFRQDAFGWTSNTKQRS